MSKTPLAEEVDPYLALNEKVDAVLSTVEDLTADLEKAKENADFEPTIMRSILAALKGLTKALESAREAKAPTVTVDIPKIEVPPANITVTTDAPTKWRFKVTERDENGRLVDGTIEAVK